MDLVEAADRLHRLVESKLGARLLSFDLVSNDHSLADGEEVFFVRWSRCGWREAGHRTQFGTHRALLGTDEDGRDLGMLVWGHYFDGPDADVEALRDYKARVAGAISL